MRYINLTLTYLLTYLLVYQKATGVPNSTEKSENDQELSYRAFLHGLLKEPIIGRRKFKMANGRHIENCSWPYLLLSYCILRFDECRLSCRLRYTCL